MIAETPMLACTVRATASGGTGVAPNAIELHPVLRSAASAASERLDRLSDSYQARR